jgi:hypothetical protein
MTNSTGNNHILTINTETQVADIKHFSDHSFLNSTISPTNVNVEYIYTDNNKILKTKIDANGELSGTYEDREQNLVIEINHDVVKGATNLEINQDNYGLNIENGKLKSASFLTKGNTHDMRIGIDESKKLDFEFNRTTDNQSYSIKINKDVVKGELKMEW